MPKARISGPPSGQTSLANGIGTLNRLLSLTLGPHTGTILVENNGHSRASESLDDSLTLSQRLLELPDPFEDMGSQILRKALTSVGAKSQDGAATCAAIANAILREARPLLAFGYDSHQLTREVTTTCAHLIAELNRRAEPINYLDEIEAVLRSALVDPSMANMVIEIVNTVGPEGAVKVEESRLPEMAYEYVQGGRWTTKLASPYLLNSKETVVTAHDPVIVVSMTPLATPDHLVPALETAASTASRNLVLVAPKFSDHVISTLVMNRERGLLKAALAMLAPTSIHFGSEVLKDIGTLAGAKVDELNTAGTARRIRAEELGGADQVWASMSAFGIIGGRGNAEALSDRVRTLRSQIADEQNAVKQRQLKERVGTLEGISALVRVPNRTAAFGENRTRKVEKAIAVARQAVREGTLPGGGAALAHCAADVGNSDVLSPGSRVLLQAVREPMSTILENSGTTPGPILDQLSGRNWHDAFDVIRGDWVDTREAGLLDTVAGTRIALQTAVSVALMVLSTDTLVSRKAAHQHL